MVNLTPTINEIENEAVNIISPNHIGTLVSGILGVIGLANGHNGVDTVKNLAVDLVNNLVKPEFQKEVVDNIFTTLYTASTTALNEVENTNTTTTTTSN
jgi:CheY-specific phosphatase CheX